MDHAHATPPNPSASPASNGPNTAPPPLPTGWYVPRPRPPPRAAAPNPRRIAQWDPASQRYYFVQPSTGMTQWDVPTTAAEAAYPVTATSSPPPADGTRGGLGSLAGSLANNMLSGGVVGIAVLGAIAWRARIPDVAEVLTAARR